MRQDDGLASRSIAEFSCDAPILLKSRSHFCGSKAVLLAGILVQHDREPGAWKEVLSSQKEILATENDFLRVGDEEYPSLNRSEVVVGLHAEISRNNCIRLIRW